MAQKIGTLNSCTSFRIRKFFLKYVFPRMFGVVHVFFLLVFMSFQAANAAQFTELRGQGRLGSAIMLETRVSDLDSNAESQLQNSCLNATWRPLNGAGVPSGSALPISVNFSLLNPTSGVIRFNGRFALSDPVGQVVLRSNCPLSVFEVTWTLVAEEPLAKPLPSPAAPVVPTVPVSPKRAVLAELESSHSTQKMNPKLSVGDVGTEHLKSRVDVISTSQNEFALGDIQVGKRSKSSDSLALSEHKNQDVVVERNTTYKLKDESKVLPKTKALHNQPELRQLNEVQKPLTKSTAEVNEAQSPEFPNQSHSVRVEDSSSMVDALAPKTMASVGGVEDGVGEPSVKVGDELAQLDEKLMGVNMVPSQVNPDSHVLPSVSLEDNARNMMQNLFDSVSPLVVFIFCISVLLLSAGAWFVFKKSRSNDLFSTKTNLKMDAMVFKRMRNDSINFQGQKDNVRAEPLSSSEEVQNVRAKDLELDTPVIKTTRKLNDEHSHSILSDAGSNAVNAMFSNTDNSLVHDEHQEEKSKPKRKVKVDEKSKPEHDSVRLMQSFLGADVPLEAVAPPDVSKRPVLNSVPERADDVAREERLAEGIAQIKRAHIDQWQLPEAYQDMVEERNRSLAHSSSDVALTIRAHLGLLELAYLEAKEGQILEPKWAIGLLNKLLGKKRIDAQKTLGNDVPDVILSFLTMRAYEISDPNCRAVFKSNCMLLSQGLKSHQFCFASPAWTVAVDAAFPELQSAGLDKV